MAPNKLSRLSISINNRLALGYLEHGNVGTAGGVFLNVCKYVNTHVNLQSADWLLSSNRTPLWSCDTFDKTFLDQWWPVTSKCASNTRLIKPLFQAPGL